MWIITLLLVQLVFADLQLESSNTGQSEITVSGDEAFNFGACCANNVNIANYVYRVRKSNLEEESPLKLWTNPDALVYDSTNKVLLVMEANCCGGSTRGIQVIDTENWKITANISLPAYYFNQWGVVSYDAANRTVWATNHIDYNTNPLSLELVAVTLDESFTNATEALVSCSSSTYYCTFLSQQQQISLQPNAIYVAGYNLEYGKYVRSEVVKTGPLDGSMINFVQYPNDTVSVISLYAAESPQGTVLLTVVVNGSKITLNRLDSETLNIEQSVDITHMMYKGQSQQYFVTFAYDQVHNTVFMIAPVIGQLDLDTFTFVSTLNVTSQLWPNSYLILGVDADWETQDLFVLGSSGSILSTWLKVSFTYTNEKAPAVRTQPEGSYQPPYWIIAAGAYVSGNSATTNLIDPTGSVHSIVHSPYLDAPIFGSNGILFNNVYYTAAYEYTSGSYVMQYAVDGTHYQYNTSGYQLSSLAVDEKHNITYALIPNLDGVFQIDLNTLEIGNEVFHNDEFYYGDQMAFDSTSSLLYAAFNSFNIALVDILDGYNTTFTGPGPLGAMLVAEDGHLIAVQQIVRPPYNGVGVFEIVSIKFSDGEYSSQCFTSPCTFNVSSIMLSWNTEHQQLLAITASQGIDVNSYTYWRYQLYTFDAVHGHQIGDAVYVHSSIYYQLFGLNVIPYFPLC